MGMLLHSLADAPRPIADAGDAARSPADFAEPARLLLVDDEPRLLASLSALLDDSGYQLTTATCGNEAIAQLATAPFDLVLLDLQLPDVGGHEIMDFIIAQGIDTGVIVLSGNTEIDAAIGALNRDAYGYLRKPYRPEALVAAVSSALHKRRIERDRRRLSAQLQSSERLYRYLVDSSPDIIYTVDVGGRFTFVNDRMAQLLGFTRDQIVGQHFSLLIYDEDMERARYAFTERRAGERASRNIELRLKNRKALERENDPASPAMISVSSLGMYSQEPGNRHRQYIGTYGVARDITERKRAEALISYQAYHDILTDLPNRVLFNERLEAALVQARRNRAELAVMFVDLDRFKEVNDTLGHIKGDELLRQVAGRLKNTVRRGDTLARLGGDEFSLLLPDLRHRTDAALIAEKFLECLQAPFYLDGHEAHVSASIGISIFPGDGDTEEDLIRHADIAMYQVKAQGKNGHAFFDAAMLQASSRKQALERNLRRAIEQDELEMTYQPQINVATGFIAGVEAVPRWIHPDHGLLPADELLPFAQDNGLVVPLTEWMLHAICRDLAASAERSIPSLPVSLSVSAQCLNHADFGRRFQNVLAHYGISANQFEMQITEDVGILNQQHAVDQVNALVRMGVRIAIEDFGIGYSSLTYLHRFPVHTVRIHRSFVREIQRVDDYLPAVLAIVSMARGLGLKLVAEGVDTPAQAAYLERAGCAVMQGEHYSPPVPYGALQWKLAAQAVEQS